MHIKKLIIFYIFGIITAIFFVSEANAANRYWVGGSGNWSDGANHWANSSGGAPAASRKPGSSDKAIFDSNSGGGTCTVNETVDIRGLDMQSGNTTTISQGANTVTIGNQNAVITAGTFTGGTANITLANNGTFTVSGGTFNSTTATLTCPAAFTVSSGTFNGSSGTIDLNGTFSFSGGIFTATSGTMYCGNDFTISGGIFTHNSGTIVFDTRNMSINSGSAALNNVTFNAANTFTIANGTTMTVNGMLTLTDGTINTGTIAAKGNISLGSAFDGGTASLNINGTGAQTFTGAGSATTGTCLAVTINKASGALNLASIIRTDKNWTYSQGTISSGTSTVVFYAASTINGAMEFDSLTFNANATFTIAASSQVVVEDDFTLTNGTVSIPATSSITVGGTTTLTNGSINTGTLKSQGGVTIAATFDGGTGKLSLIGATDQTLTGNNNGIFPATLDINKSSGTATITGTCSGIQNITVTSGTLDFAGGFTYTVDDADSITVASGATISLTGSAGSMVTLRSDANNRAFDLIVNSGAFYDASYVAVRDSNASGGKTIYAANSTNNGGNTNWIFYTPGTLTGTNVEPASLTVGVEGLVRISFITANVLPVDGVIIIDFPAGFDGAGCDTVSNQSGIDGNFSVTISNGDGTNDIITITRSGGTQLAASTEVIFDINSITNPSIAGSTGTYSITTYGAGSSPQLDTDAAVTADIIEEESAPTVSKIAFTTSEQTVQQNSASGMITIETQDASGNSVNVSSNTTINLSTTSSGGQFSDSSLFSTIITSVTISAGADNASFYYRDSNTGSPTITASENPSQGWTDAAQTIEITLQPTAWQYSLSAASPQVAGNPFTLTISALQSDGAVLTTYSGTANLSVSYILPSTGTGTLSVTSTSGFVNGVATITNETFSDCGTITITAVDSVDNTITGTTANILFLPYDFLVAAAEAEQTVNKTFSLTATARNAQGLTCPNYKGPANITVNYISPAISQSGTLTPATLAAANFISGIASLSTASYNKWGIVTLTVSDATLSTRTGTSGNILFKPKDFLLTPAAPPKSRDFYYLNEEFGLTVTARDNNNNTVTNYQGTIAFSGTDLLLPANYAFIAIDSGSKLFSALKSDVEGTKTLTITDANNVSGTVDIIIKKGIIRIKDAQGPVGTINVDAVIMDSEGNVISNDNSTTFIVTLSEVINDNSAASPATDEEATITGGGATIEVTDTQGETVTVTPKSTPELEAEAGEVTFGTAAQGSIGIQIWRELKEGQSK